MTTEPLTPEQEEERRHQQNRLEFARTWMQRKREEQARMIEEAKTDPEIIAAFAELKRSNEERGTCIVEL